MNGIINVYKPSGCTSQHIVSAIRKIFATKEVGHMGTLDPQGEGVLPVGIGKSTRLFDVMLRKDKVYEATFKFGYETDTLDKDGAIVSQTHILPSYEEIKKALPFFVGEIDQLPPKYSAKNINGKRAYDLARAGFDFQLKPSRIMIYSFELIKNIGEAEYLFKIHCSAGTYIRSLCRDLAKHLGSQATMTSIKRLKSGEFDIEHSYSIDEIRELKTNAVIPVEQVLAGFPCVEFPPEMYKKISCGVAFPYNYDKNKLFTVYCVNEFFGLGMVDDVGIFKIKTYLRDNING